MRGKWPLSSSGSLSTSAREALQTAQLRHRGNFNLIGCAGVLGRLAMFAQSLAEQSSRSYIVPGEFGGRVGDVALPGRGVVGAERAYEGLAVRGVCGGRDAPLREQATRRLQVDVVARGVHRHQRSSTHLLGQKRSDYSKVRRRMPE